MIHLSHTASIYFQEIPLTVTYKEYWQKLREHCMVKMYAICRVQETGQTWTDEDDFQVEKPKLNINVSIFSIY